MLVENIMYFVLGLLVAGLMALVIMPAIWRRAVRLTKRRIEAATPISMAEFRADKDHLRADFALQTRRLELTIDNLRQRLSEQLGEVAQARVDAVQIKIEREQHAALIIENDKRETLLRARITELEKEVATLNQDLRRFSRGEPDAIEPTTQMALSEAEASFSRAEMRLNSILAKPSRAGELQAGPSLLADELSSLEASDALRKQVLALEAKINETWASNEFTEDVLRRELMDVASGISRLVYAAEEKPAASALEESLFDRIKRFADDGETEDLLPAPAVTQRGTVTDRLAALRELRGN
jgi:chromosome segregation ATPase